MNATLRTAAAATLALLCSLSSGPPAPAQDGGPGGKPAVPPAAPPVAEKESPAALAYGKGLAFLRARAVEGKWGPPGKADPGITALVLTAFLERPGGPSEKDGPLVDGAVAWLRSLQKEDGGIYEDANGNYTTSLAVQALVLHGKEKHADAVARALVYLRRMQFHEEGGEGRVVGRGDLRYGGIGYGSDPTQPDLSNTQFALESLRAAGVPESDPAIQRALVFLQRSQNRKENETAGEPAERKDGKGRTVVHSTDGGASYRPFDSKAGDFERPDGKVESRSYGSMTYALLKCYVYAGAGAADPRVADAVKWIRKNYTWEENPGFPDPAAAQQGLFYYYATAARALALLAADAAGTGADGKPRDWRADLTGRLLSLQREDGGWVNPNDRWMEGLPEIPTAFALKALAAAAE